MKLLDSYSNDQLRKEIERREHAAHAQRQAEIFRGEREDNMANGDQHIENARPKPSQY